MDRYIQLLLLQIFVLELNISYRMRGKANIT